MIRNGMLVGIAICWCAFSCADESSALEKLQQQYGFQYNAGPSAQPGPTQGPSPMTPLSVSELLSAASVVSELASKESLGNKVSADERSQYIRFQVGRVLSLREKAQIPASVFLSEILPLVENETEPIAVREALLNILGRDQDLLEEGRNQRTDVMGVLSRIYGAPAEEAGLRRQALEAGMSIVRLHWIQLMRESGHLSRGRNGRTSELRPEAVIRGDVSLEGVQSEEKTEALKLASDYCSEVEALVMNAADSEFRDVAWRCLYQIYDKVPIAGWEETGEFLLDARIVIARNRSLNDNVRAKHLPSRQLLGDLRKTEARDYSMALDVLREIYLATEEPFPMRRLAMQEAVSLIDGEWRLMLVMDAEERQLSPAERLWHPEAILRGDYKLTTVSQERIDVFQELADAFYLDLRAMYDDEKSDDRLRYSVRDHVVSLCSRVPFAHLEEAARFSERISKDDLQVQ